MDLLGLVVSWLVAPYMKAERRKPLGRACLIILGILAAAELAWGQNVYDDGYTYDYNNYYANNPNQNTADPPSEDNPANAATAPATEPAREPSSAGSEASAASPDADIPAFDGVNIEGEAYEPYNYAPSDSAEFNAQMETAAPPMAPVSDSPPAPASSGLAPETLVLPPELATIKPVQHSLGILAPGDAPHHYVIQPGDTLYDICDQLLDEPDYWPKLWSLNPEIKNPHFVWPGMILRFYPGDESLPPYLEIKEAEDLYPVYLDDDFTPESLVSSPLKLENETIPFRPVPQLPALMDPAEVNAIDPFPIVTTQPSQRDIEISLPFFVFNKKVKQLGTIVGSTLEGFSLEAAGLLVAKDNLQVGGPYTVVRFSHVLRDPHNGRFLGLQYTNVAEIVITETHTSGLRRARGAYNNKIMGHTRPLKHPIRSLAMYQPTHILGSIQRGDLVVAHIGARVRIPGQPQSKGRNVDASVVSFGISDQQLSSSNSFLVLHNADLRPGEEVSLYKERQVMDNFHGLRKYYQSGVAQIVAVADTTATAYVMTAASSVMLGDRFSPSPP